MVVVDGYSQIYRGYYAVRGLTSASGQPSNAVHALAKFLLRLDREYPSAYGAVALDLGKCAARLAITPAYKANRQPMPDDLRSQMPYIRRWIEAAGWPILEHQGVEADDIIAAVTAEFADLPVLIVSADKDLAG
jgi:DNA polymerase-1